MIIPLNILNFKHPATCVVAGPSKAGKTEFLISVLNNHKFFFPTLSNPRIAWYSGTSIDLKRFATTLRVKIIKELPKSFGGWDILVCDDLMQECAGSKNLVNIFTRTSHHENVSVFFLTQRLFYKSENFNVINRNSDYIVLLKNIRDQSSFFALARQLSPTKPSQLLQIFSEATAKPYSAIRIDFTNSCPDEFRFLGNLTSTPLSPIAYTFIEDVGIKNKPNKKGNSQTNSQEKATQK